MENKQSETITWKTIKELHTIKQIEDLKIWLGQTIPSNGVQSCDYLRWRGE